MMSTCKHGQPRSSGCQLCKLARLYGEEVTGGEASHLKGKEADAE